MSRTVVLPPDETPGPDGVKGGGWWHESDDGRRIVCDLCPRACKLAPGDRGFCFVRQNLAGRMVSTTYGRSTGFCIDPIEKKPLNHFYPGTSVLSFGTAGCNLGCKFCQNWTSTKSREVDLCCDTAEPEAIAMAAKQHGCRSVAFTYNDPIVWAEYAIDTAWACRALGIKTVAVTSGYITPLARPAFYEAIDAANVDLKGFAETFYWKLCAGHLEPVRDTLRWLVRQTNVWVEITNLIIPRANDSEDELRRMCDWVAEELGPDVPLHFSAFHPDFRLTDRGVTPLATLLKAHQIARSAGLRYVYTGNVSDAEHQSTYCPSCGRLLIERDGYLVGAYALDEDRCGQCGARIAGHFDAAPGNWGARRVPIRIGAPIRAKRDPGTPAILVRSGSPSQAQGVSTMESQGSQETIPSAAHRPLLSREQEEAVFQAAGRRVVAAVRGQAPERLDAVLGEAAGVPLVGAFVTLKRAGQLRACCGFLGQSVPLAEAIDQAAVRSAKEDYRFAPISPAELPHLDMDVWLLWGMEPVRERGQERVKAVEIGRHGLQISRGSARGLLLPGVAVEHGFDAEEFLKHVCLKAGLPPHAWKDDDTTLMRFEGYAIHGPLRPGPAPPHHPSPGGPTLDEVAALAEFCRQNVVAMVLGATPSFYLPGSFDGGVSGVIVTARLPGGAEVLDCSHVTLRSDTPLQSTLFDLAKAVARAFQARRIDLRTLHAVRLGLAVLWDPVVHGTAAKPDLEGFDPRLRAVLVTDRSRWACAYDPQLPAAEVLRLAIERLQLPEGSQAQVCSLAVASTEPRLAVSRAPQPQAGPAVRVPAWAGPDGFYPADPDEVQRRLDEMLPATPQPEPWAGAMVPHAGWKYSGRLAAAVLSRIRFPSRVIIFCPRHRGPGPDWAVAPHQTWAVPGGKVDADPDLARRMAAAVAGLELDAGAHQVEHAIEVQLPILARLAPDARVVGVAMHGGDYPSLQRFAEQLAAVLRDLPERPLLLISTDMSHRLNDAQARRVDRLALEHIERLDPAGLYRTVSEKGISMCGMVPAVVVMETLRQLGALNRCEPVGYATSGDVTGDKREVVGYAGMLFA